MPANFTMMLLELDGLARRRARRHQLARVVVFGTLIPVVLAQLVFVVGLFWPQPVGCGRTRRAVMADVMGVVGAVERFQALNRGRCPRDIGELARNNSRAHKDPWGRPLMFECTADGIRVCSSGRDEVEPGDDVCSDDASVH